jgi:hypothetical protein
VNTTSALSRRVIAIEISISIRYHSGCGTQRRWPGIARNICAVSLRKGSERRLVYHSPVRRGAGRLTTETADTILGAKPPRGRDHGRFDCATSRGPVDQDLDFAWPPLAFEARKRVARSFRCLGARSQHGRCVLPPLRVVVQGARISRSRPWVLSHSVPDGRRSLQDPSAHFPERVSGHFEATDSALSVDARGPGMVCPRTQSGQKWQPGGPGGRSRNEGEGRDPVSVARISAAIAIGRTRFRPDRRVPPSRICPGRQSRRPCTIHQIGPGATQCGHVRRRHNSPTPWLQYAGREAVTGTTLRAGGRSANRYR